MSRLRLEYFANLKNSIKMAIEPPSFSGTWKHQRWKESPIYPDIVSANKAITSSYQAGEIERARQLFDEMPHRTVVSWNTMITGYTKWNMFPESLRLISLMHLSNVKLNETTFSVSLSVCARAHSLISGQQVHGVVFKSGHQRFKLVGSALLYVYASCRQIGDGRRVFDELSQDNELLWSLMLMGYVECNLMREALIVFDEMPTRGVVEWTNLISGLVKSEDRGCKIALKLFKMMRESGEAVPNEITLDCAVRGCARSGDFSIGKLIHGLIIKSGFEYKSSISGALISLYSSSESMDEAHKVYHSVSSQSLDDSNELIRGLLKLGKIEEAESIFGNMIDKNQVSYNLMIKGYATCGRFEDSEKLFEQMPVRFLSCLNTMISVYGRSGKIDKALDLFKEAKGESCPISWNSMISGYVQNDLFKNAFELYLTMRRSLISETRSTFSVLFHACACMGCLQQGQIFHAHVAKTPFSSDVYVGTSLIDMYSKCGIISDARASFSSISSPNVAAWTSLINGHAHHGLGSSAVALFDLMVDQRVVPNGATFVAVLSACARAGLVDEGMRLFRLMRERYLITPVLEHYTCIVDLLGRSGLVGEAEEVIEGMPIGADSAVLTSLLHSSWSWMDVEVGERVARKMFELDTNYQSSACVIMSNMYSRSGKWGQKMEMRDLLRELGGKKDVGCSWIDVNNNTNHVSSSPV
ncbi:hypothetical protein ABFS83_06G103100 [Erythranthe nasuta]